MTVETVYPNNAAEAVASGAQLLDERFPGWWQLIDLNNLHIESCVSCVCGQLAISLGMSQQGMGPYMAMRTALGLEHGRNHGFAPSYIAYSRELEDEWTKLIMARLAADALDEVTADEKELIPV